MNDQDYMQCALGLARKGVGRTSPNPAVGCVIVKNGVIVGEGWHKKCGGPHAEVFALDQAGSESRGAVMYVTLEPCAHEGRTPPCVDKVITGGLQRVVIAMRDPNPRVRGKSIEKLRRAGIEVSIGCLQDQARQLNQSFDKWIKTGLPFVTAKIAQTLDGKIAAANGQSKWITSAHARRYTRRMRGEFDAIMVGVNTVLKDDPELSPAGSPRRWTKVVLDTHLRIPLNARMFGRYKTIVATTSGASAARIRRLEKQGVEILVCPAKRRQVDMGYVLSELGRREMTGVLIEGGSRVIGSALREQLVDRMIVIMAPKIFGDEHCLCSVNGLKAVDVNASIRIQVERSAALGCDWIFEGAVKYS